MDGLQLDTFPSVKVHSGCDFTRKNIFRIQWTEVFFLGEGQQSASRDLNKLTGELAKAFCQTLMPHLSKLSSDGLSFIGLRVNLDPDSVRHSYFICHLMYKIIDGKLFIGVFFFKSESKIIGFGFTFEWIKKNSAIFMSPSGGVAMQNQLPVLFEIKQDAIPYSSPCRYRSIPMYRLISI